MIRRPPRSTLDRSSAASDVYKRQLNAYRRMMYEDARRPRAEQMSFVLHLGDFIYEIVKYPEDGRDAVSYTHLRAHETVLDLVCRLLLEKNTHNTTQHKHSG